MPNHGWRHRFKTVGRSIGIDSRVLDAMLGHAPKTARDDYGDVIVAAMALAIAKFPWQFWTDQATEAGRVREIEDFSDSRLKGWCIHCGDTLDASDSNRDHVPTKALLTKAIRQRGAAYDGGADDEFGYLPQVTVCRSCNSSFSADENYLLCVLHAVIAGSLYPDPSEHPEAATILRSNRHVVRSLKKGPDGKPLVFDDQRTFTLFPDINRVKNVIVKNARGHAYHDIAEPLLEAPKTVDFAPLELMSQEQRAAFETTGTDGELALWPEVGSRMTVHLLDGEAMVGGWVTVEPGRYRYSIDWSDGVTVKTVIWEYLATVTHWEP